MLREMPAWALTTWELSHGIRITLVPGILKAVEEGVIKVGSCHNFCPLPTGITHAARTSSSRRRWTPASTTSGSGTPGARSIFPRR